MKRSYKYEVGHQKRISGDPAKQFLHFRSRRFRTKQDVLEITSFCEVDEVVYLLFFIVNYKCLEIYK